MRDEINGVDLALSQRAQAEALADAVRLGPEDVVGFEKVDEGACGGAEPLRGGADLALELFQCIKHDAGGGPEVDVPAAYGEVGGGGGLNRDRLAKGEPE